MSGASTDGPGRRAAVPDLLSPDPLGRRLPAVYAGDDLAQRLTEGFDRVLAPVHVTLDNLWAYLSPALAPPDFVDWIGGWVAAESGRDWPEAQRREAVANAFAHHRMRGTVAGLRAEIRDAFGVEAEIEDSGGASWSATPGSPLPGAETPRLVVRVRPVEPGPMFAERLREFVAANRPAHVPYEVQIVNEGGR